MVGANQNLVVINWDGVLQPRAASARQILNAILAFSELYLYQWTNWLAKLSYGFRQTARMTIIAANVPRVIAFYASAKVQKAINQLKLGYMLEADFFNLLLVDHFSFLLTSDLSSAEGLPSNLLSAQEKAIFLLKRAWCSPRIQDLTALEIERFKKVMHNFDRVILISNSNPTDIGCFIENVLKANILDEDRVLAKDEILTQLLSLRMPNNLTASIEDLILRLSTKVSILASPFTHEWKVQTGEVAQTTGSAGFLPRLLSSMAQATVISDAPSDRNCVKKLGAQTYSSGEYFNDRTLLQRFTQGTYDNWPLLAALMMGLVIILYLLSSFR